MVTVSVEGLILNKIILETWCYRDLWWFGVCCW